MSLEELKKKSVAELRVIALEMGIKPEKKLKKDLFDEISKKISQEEVAPNTSEKVITRGRPKKITPPVQEETPEKEDAPATENNPVSAHEDENAGNDAAAKEHQFEVGTKVSGTLELAEGGFGFLRTEAGVLTSDDTFVPPPMIKAKGLRTGDFIEGVARQQRDKATAQALTFINTVNGVPYRAFHARPNFESLVPIYPDSKIHLETTPDNISTRLIDLVAPIGKGQRGLIVSPPKAGKTMMLKAIANAITENHPEVELIVLLIDERPEEVTDIRESVKGRVIASTFDEMPEKHTKASEFCLEYAKRRVEMGQDVVILMDSITRLARSYNLVIQPTGRSLSGGLDPGALYKPKKFFGSARNIRGGGSLTIIATALVETGSRLDDVIYEEFKGTGNMEIHLSRELAERRIFPSVDVKKSGTRREDLLLTPFELENMYKLRKKISTYDPILAASRVVAAFEDTKDNAEFVERLVEIKEANTM